MTYPQIVAASPDGRSVYVGSEFSSSIAVFDRAAGGALSQRADPAGCVSETGTDGGVLGGGAGSCRDVIGLSAGILGGPYGLAVSPDGANVYAASYGGPVAVLDRGADGSLTQRSGPGACVSDADIAGCATGRALRFGRSVAVSPDGDSVYVAAESSLRDAGPGDLRPCRRRHPDPEGRDGRMHLRDRWRRLRGHDRVPALRRDGQRRRGERVRRPARGILVFDRAASGTLTQKPGRAGCVSEDGAGPCTDGTSVTAVESVAVSKDGATLVAISSNNTGTVVIFDRAADGSLTQKARTSGCISRFGGGPCVDGRGLSGARSVVLSPDGKNAYVAGSDDVLAVFDRVPVAAPPPPPPPPGPVRRPQPSCPAGGIQGAGTEGVDALTGAARRDILFGLADADLLRGLAGRDCLYGGDGDDRLFGGSGADRLFGGPGEDRLDGEDGRDRLEGGPGARQATSGDYLSGGSGRDRLVDRRGNATFVGGTGSDRIDARDASARDRRRRDVVRCGTGRGTALADAADRVAADCERVVRRRP